MRFDISNYKGKYAMHCKTEEEAKDFCEYLHNHGKRWCSGDSYKAMNAWGMHTEDTAYAFNIGEYSYAQYYEKNGYTILEWEDFMKIFTKADLKTGDVILRRDGYVEIINLELEMCICQNGGYNDLEDIEGDLTCKCGDPHDDIIAVRRPIRKRDCSFNAFKEEWGILIYDRERDEVEEMTLEQVCKLLGKNIKIIK